MSNAERLMEVLAPVFAGGEREIDERAIDEMLAAASGLMAPDVSGAMHGGPNFELEFRSLDELREAWRDWLEVFATVRFEFEDVQQIGDNVVTFVRQTGITRHDEVEITQPSAAVWKFADGAVVAVEFHLDREAALASAREPG